MKNNWQNYKGSEILIKDKGKLPSDIQPDAAEGYLPYLTMAYITNKESQYAKVDNSLIANKDDILVVGDGSGSGHVYTGFSGVVASTFYRLKPSEKVFSKFLYYLLTSDDLSQPQYRKGGAIPHFDISKILIQAFNIPDKTIQQKIIIILTAVDEALLKTDQIIQKGEILKKGLVDELFTHGYGWKIMQIKEFAHVKGGKRLPKGMRFAEMETNHPYIRVTDFDQGTVNLNNLKFISHDTYEKIKRYIINKEDIFVSIAGSIGFAGIIPNELDGAILTENAARIVLVKKDVLQKYLYYFLISTAAQNYFNKVVSKSGQPKLALFKIENLEVPVPPTDKQRRIAEILTALDEKISVNKKFKAKLTLIKKGLMQDIFSQKVQIN